MTRATTITPARVPSFFSSAGSERVKISERAPAIRVVRLTLARTCGAASEDAGASESSESSFVRGVGCDRANTFGRLVRRFFRAPDFRVNFGIAKKLFQGLWVLVGSIIQKSDRTGQTWILPTSIPFLSLLSRHRRSPGLRTQAKRRKCST